MNDDYKIDDEEINFEVFLKKIDEENSRQKNVFISEIITHGEDYIDEIKNKNQKKQILRNKKIKFIKENSDEYSLKQLKFFSDEELSIIWEKIKAKKQNFFIKLLKFIFNFE